MSGKRKGYYPNNWKAYKDSPDEMFHRHTFDEVMIAKMSPVLRDDVCGILREYKDGKVVEKAYQRCGNATNRINEIIGDPDIDFVFVDHYQFLWNPRLTM